MPDYLLHECVATFGTEMLSLGAERAHKGSEFQIWFHAVEVTLWTQLPVKPLELVGWCSAHTRLLASLAHSSGASCATMERLLLARLGTAGPVVCSGMGHRDSLLEEKLLCLPPHRGNLLLLLWWGRLVAQGALGMESMLWLFLTWISSDKISSWWERNSLIPGVFLPWFLSVAITSFPHSQAWEWILLGFLPCCISRDTVNTYVSPLSLFCASSLTLSLISLPIHPCPTPWLKQNFPLFLAAGLPRGPD